MHALVSLFCSCVVSSGGSISITWHTSPLFTKPLKVEGDIAEQESILDCTPLSVILAPSCLKRVVFFFQLIHIFPLFRLSNQSMPNIMSYEVIGNTLRSVVNLCPCVNHVTAGKYSVQNKLDVPDDQPDESVGAARIYQYK
jgi:hypothetical protein